MQSLSFLLISAWLTFTEAYFPDGRCYVNSCDASPYQFKTINQTCFSIEKQACIDTSVYQCCTVFEKLLNKIVIKSDPICKNTVSAVYINGIKKPGSVFFDLNSENEGQLRITNLQLTNYPDFTTVCIISKDPCANLTTFCPDQCMIAAFNTDTHTCCPTCDLLGKKVLMPPPSPPPPPPPKSPPPPSSPPPPKSPLSPSPSPSPPPKSPSPPPPPPPSPPPPPPPSPPPPPPPSPPPPSPPPPLPKYTCQKCQCNCTECTI